jgi:hypothetical protein
MVRVDLLHGEMARAGYNRTSLSKKIGISPNTFLRKEKLGIFGSDEIVKIVQLCNIENPMPIFFPEFVTRDATR